MNRIALLIEGVDKKTLLKTTALFLTCPACEYNNRLKVLKEEEI